MILFKTDQSVRAWFDGAFRIGSFVRYEKDTLIVRVPVGEFDLPTELSFPSYDVKPMESVELIASGYEWICPNCDCNNHEIGVEEMVVCKDCEEQFEVKEYYHA